MLKGLLTNKWFIVAIVVVILLVIYFGFLNNQIASDFPGANRPIDGSNAVSPDAQAIADILADDGTDARCGKDCRGICKCQKLFDRSKCKRRCKSDCAQGLPYKTKAAQYCNQ